VAFDSANVVPAGTVVEYAGVSPEGNLMVEHFGSRAVIDHDDAVPVVWDDDVQQYVDQDADVDVVFCDGCEDTFNDDADAHDNPEGLTLCPNCR